MAAARPLAPPVVLAALLLLCGFDSIAGADTPSAEYLFPAGGQRGTTVRFRVGGTYFHGRAEFLMSGPGVTASPEVTEVDTVFFEGPMIYKPASQRAENYPRDHAGEVQIDADAAVGARYWRTRTSQGVTPSRPFLIGDLPEIIEEEIDGPPVPAAVRVNTTINGRIFPREDVDVWTFQAERGRWYQAEVLAEQLGSPLDSLIQVVDPDGRLIAENDDSAHSRDSLLAFRAQRDGIYQLRIYDSQFRGLQSYVYRLTLREGPPNSQPFPLAIEAGSDDRLQPGWRKLPFGTPADQSLTRRWVSTLPVVQRDDDDEVGQPITGPFVGAGRMTKQDQRWTWKAEVPGKYDLQLTPADPRTLLSIDVEDDEGKSLARFQPDPTRPQHPTLTFTAGESTVQLRISSSTSGTTATGSASAATSYVLICRRQQPDFQLRLDTDAVTLNRGGEASLKVLAERRQFTGEIKLRVETLAAESGVTVSESKIPAKKPIGAVAFKADKQARVRPHEIRVIGEAEIDGKTVTRVATLPSPLAPKDRDRVVLGVSMPTPFQLDGIAFETRYGARGTRFRRHFVVHRNGYHGPLTVRLADRQIRHLQGVTAEPIEVAKDANEFDYPIRIPTWLEMNRTSRTVVMAIGTVKDELGQEHQVSYTSSVPKDQIILLTAPCPIAITTPKPSLRVSPGEIIEVPFRIDRGVLKSAPAVVRLLFPRHFQGVRAEPLTLAPNRTEGVLRVHIDERLGVLNMPVTLQMETLHDGAPVIAETKLKLSR